MPVSGPSYSLLELCENIKGVLRSTYTQTYWVRAEINTLNLYPASGHCYPDLVEKQNGSIVAQMRANLWKGDYQRINSTFLNVLKEPLRDGIKVLMLVEIQFHPVYGLSLNIQDMDPAFSLGDLEQEKQRCIQTLKEEGLLSRNRALPKPWLPQRIALISDASSKGYGDFTKVLAEANKQWGYAFYFHLFPAVLQGERAVVTIQEQLQKIQKVKTHFDVVALVRGGGGEVGMACYNNLELNRALTTFSLPVLTGIGHASNLTVAEQIAWHNAITPTKLAEWLVQQFHNLSVPLQKCEEALTKSGLEVVADARQDLQHALRLLVATARSRQISHRAEWQQTVQQLSSSSRYLTKHHHNLLEQNRQQITQGMAVRSRSETLSLDQSFRQLLTGFKQTLGNQRQRLDFLNTQVQNLSPEQVLKRGFSIVTQGGKPLNNTKDIQLNRELKIQLFRGELSAQPIEIHHSNEPI
ncbi:MAG: exodeoxyribonuclease VII large subunit [Bacteroidetes bacterium]|nr:exodeoxyribonuclease VII large subunit [Bacteroidota bacterium]